MLRSQYTVRISRYKSLQKKSNTERPITIANIYVARAPPARRKILKLDAGFIKKILKVFKDFACLKGG